MTSASDAASAPNRPARGGMRAYLQLFRLPNVFTAIADVTMGFLVTWGTYEPAGIFVLIIAASCLLYTAGMVLNDVFDYEVDLAERPARPLPSGRIQLSWARFLGVELLILGAGCAWAASYLSGDARTGIVSLGLVVAILLYNRLLKQTPLGPIGMGLCRSLNVLMGMGAAGTPWQTWHLLIAAGIGVYIAGVTWFARSEATRSGRAQLTVATIIMLAGLALLAYFPQQVEPQRLFALLRVQPGRWHMMWGMLGLLVAWRCARAIADPSALNVQIAVKQSILSLIILDAVVAFALVGYAAVPILALLVPALVLGRWIYST